jgi:AraC family transcriptional regulator of adaptative response/methylated-DNA-[protein]-cysteine methyltransferase
MDMTSNKRRAAEAHAEVQFAIRDCSLGRVLVATRGHGVCAILLGDNPTTLKRELRARFPEENLADETKDAAALATMVVESIDAPTRRVDLPLDVGGTPFQRKVWQALRKIPAGKTASYAEIARKVGSPKSVRAVAQACAANALAVAIPCHRVVRSDGSLSGYRWGVERKRRLLDLEASA